MPFSNRQAIVCVNMILCMIQTCSAVVMSDCVRTERFVDGKCEPCPRCAPGFGLEEECGHGHGAGLQCVACPPGFYNPPPGGSHCLICTNCSVFHRQAAYQCRPIIDAECGACKPGYFDRRTDHTFSSNFIYLCSRCRTKTQHPQCQGLKPLIAAPATRHLQADTRSENKDAASLSELPNPMAFLTVLHGRGCMLSVIVLILFLLHRWHVIRYMHHRPEAVQAFMPSCSIQWKQIIMSREVITFSTCDVIICIIMILCLVHTCSALVMSDCVRTERFVDGKCEPCPRCAPGFGLLEKCGHGHGAGLQCLACPPGFYNPPPGGSSCLICTNCSTFHRQATYQCRSVIDAECGICQLGYFDRRPEHILGSSFIYRCSTCRRTSHHPQCRRPRPLVAAPVTIRLQANARSEDKDAASPNHSPHTMGLLAVVLGGGCLLSLIILTLFLLHHRRVVRRMLHRTVAGYTDQSHPKQDADVTPSSGAAALQQHAARWCPGLGMRTEPQPDAKRKRKQHASSRPPSRMEEADAGETSDLDCLLGESRHRKRPKVMVTTSGKGTSGLKVACPKVNNDTAMTLTLRPKPPALQLRDADGHLTSNNPHCSDNYDVIATGGINPNRKRHEDTEDEPETEGEDDGDGLPVMDAHGYGDIAMDMEDGWMVTPPRHSQGEDAVMATDNDNAGFGDNEDDLQQYGACALPTRHQAAADDVTDMWPCYVDFRDFDLGDGDIDLGASRGSSGNISEASTVLIRGPSGSPPTGFVDEGSRDIADRRDYVTVERHVGAIADNTAVAVVHSQPTLPTPNPSFEPNFSNLLPDLPLPPDSPTTFTTEETLTLDLIPVFNNSATIPPSLSYPPPLSPFSDVTDSFLHISINNDVTYPVVGPAPRRLAALAKNFTGSRGDVAHSAEAETESVPRMLENMDEERYAQALRLAKDHLVAELDFDLTERLAATLHPRPLPGDRNFRHLGAALGVPPEVMGGVRAFDDVLAHFRRQRVSLVGFLKAVRALGRMDVVHLLSVWVHANFVPVSQDGATIGDWHLHERPLAHIALPETQGPPAEDDETRPYPVQESGDTDNE